MLTLDLPTGSKVARGNLSLIISNKIIARRQTIATALD
jgi:hypothetical protein